MIRDPANSGIFLLIDQIEIEPKPNPLAGLGGEQAANRQGSYPGYHLILLREVRYTQAGKGPRTREFTYNRNGVMELRVLNRNILANARHAYALYWSTPVSGLGRQLPFLPGSSRLAFRHPRRRPAYATHTLATRGRADGSSCRGHQRRLAAADLPRGKSPNAGHCER